MLRRNEATGRFAVWTALAVTFLLQLQTLPVGGAEIVFAPPDAFEHGHNTFGIVAADLDGDGDLDLSVANATAGRLDRFNANTASVVLNNGDGTFAPADNYKVGNFPVSIATSDINGDGSLDLVLANQESSDVSVLLNRGDGTFADPINTFVGGILQSVITGDFNGDDASDLSVVNWGDNELSVLLGNGDGTFEQPVVYSTGSGPRQVTTGDLNRDGNLDLITANSDSNDVSVLFGNEDGTFGQSVNYAAGRKPMSVAIADVDNDGDLDLAVANKNTGGITGSITIHLNNGDGSFADSLKFNAGPNANFVMAGDLDLDGNLDLAVANANSQGRVSTLRGNGDGTFEKPTFLKFSGAGRQSELWFGSLTMADLDGDGELDLAVPNSNTANSGTNGIILLNITERMTKFPIGDFDKNGQLDVADIGMLMSRIAAGTQDVLFDVTDDDMVTQDDVVVWIKDLKNTWLGDANLDGEFNSGDLVTVLAAGEFEDDIELNSGWATGDWNADGEFTSADIVVALADGGFGQGTRAAVSSVPEPSSAILLVLGIIGLSRMRRHRV